MVIVVDGCGSGLQGGNLPASLMIREGCDTFPGAKDPPEVLIRATYAVAVLIGRLAPPLWSLNESLHHT